MPRRETLMARSWRSIKEQPKEIFNIYLIYCVLITAFAGVAKGIDEGNVASIVTMPSFRRDFGLNKMSTIAEADTKGWIISIATAGAVPGAFACIKMNQEWGRLWALRFFTVIYLAGVVGQACSGGNLSGLYASRFIAGIGIGATTVMPSMYIAEISPATIRGLAVLQYAACQQLGVLFGFFFAYGTRHHLPNTDSYQWRLSTFLQLIPGVIWLLGSFGCVESPRWLLTRNKDEQAKSTLSKLRNLDSDHPLVADEFKLMVQARDDERAAKEDNASLWQLSKELFATANSRRRFWIVTLAHVFGQWSGANAITQYSPTIFTYLGIKGDATSLLATGAYGVVKFVSTLVVAIFVIDIFGRRRALMTGICMQIVTLTIVGAYLGATNGMTTAHIESTPSLLNASRLSIVAIYFHAIAWSIGWFSLPYLLSAELFPTRLRSLCYGTFMAWHWLLYFGCSRAMSSMLVAFHRYGAFVFFASICVIGLVFVFFCVPDTTGRNLEQINRLFDNSAFSLWRHAYVTEEEENEAIATMPEFKNGQNGDNAMETGQHSPCSATDKEGSVGKN